MGKYNLGEVWWTQFPFEEIEESKRRPAIVIDDNTIAVLSLMVTSKDKNNPYSIKIDEWQKAGLKKESWARIDRIVQMDEWRMEKKIGDLSETDLLKITQLVAEYISGIYHEFSLLAITNSEGKYLQLYDQRWKCWLFPYYRTKEPNKENIDKHASELLKMDVTTSYVTRAPHCKYSESDKVYKQYKHTLYRFSLNEVPEYMRGDVFELENNKYSWKSIEELESDGNVMSKNDDIIAFVKTKCK
jgi:mRNA-degrading endonuclease toxin of MazEF toxin-antitoxin module